MYIVSFPQSESKQRRAPCPASFGAAGGCAKHEEVIELMAQSAFTLKSLAKYFYNGENGMKKEFWFRVLRAAGGLVLFALGLNMTINANIGVAPWDMLAIGISHHIPFTYGEILTFLSVLILLIDVAMREKIGIGTVLDALIVGKTVDFFNWIGLVPVLHNVWGGIALMLGGLVVIAFSQVFYMKAALCCGPRDALLVGLGKRLRKLPIGLVNIILLLAVMIGGLLLGGPLGIGTVIAVFGQGAVLQVVCRICKFEPRSVEHEGITDMYRAFKSFRQGTEKEETPDESRDKEKAESEQ